MTTAEGPATTARRSRARRGEGDLLRDEILAATDHLLLDAGDPEAVSIRAVARAVGVTPPAIYLHFADKTDLIYQVCQDHWDRLTEDLRTAVTDIDDPLTWLDTAGRAYIAWGLAQPQAYRVMFMGRPQDVPDDVDKAEVITAGIFGDLLAVVVRAVETGTMSGDPVMLAFQAWICVHGLVSLLVSTPEMPWPDHDRLITATIETVLRAGGGTP
ncbi:TetR/AcrR family transcriptional regulator [soil metagenome]